MAAQLVAQKQEAVAKAAAAGDRVADAQAWGTGLAEAQDALEKAEVQHARSVILSLPCRLTVTLSLLTAIISQCHCRTDSLLQ